MNENLKYKKHFFGRRKGHTLSSRQKALLKDRLEEFELTLSGDEKSLTPDDIFSNEAPLWFEIGFGKGEHLAWQAEANPNINFIGCEPFVNGVVGLLERVVSDDIKNIRIYPDDARDVVARFADASIDKIFLLHPDPWPKAKHAKRRFVSQENLDSLARVLKTGGTLRIGTDHYEYARWTMCQMALHGGFNWQAEKADDWRKRPDDWPETRYHQKAEKDGIRPLYLSFVKNH